MSPRKQRSLPFHGRLVLNQYMLNLFGVQSFDDLTKGLKDSENEGVDEGGTSLLYYVIEKEFGDRFEDGKLREYDENIVRHTRRIAKNRSADEAIIWRYFQYLSLLFTEIYLDRYFRVPDTLLDELNRRVETLNADVKKTEQVGAYKSVDLQKLAFWMATGSGKTLLMHVNLLQFQHYLGKHGDLDQLNKIILLTPNEGLSRQHHDEFQKSGLNSTLVSGEDLSLFTDGMDGSRRIEIISIHRLGEDTGVKTVAVESYEGNNLVLVDEGHRGASGVEWRGRRDRLCRDGFSFEYSATFGQAVKATSGKQHGLVQEYAKCILFDYSYGYFYRDGYGKDFQIVNLEAERHEDVQRRYLTANLLAFYQQQVLYEEDRDRRSFARYGIERPLWMFICSRVTNARDERTDAAEILLFLAEFVRNRAGSIADLDRLISGDTGLTAGNRDLFADKFPYLVQRGFTGERLYREIMRSFFNLRVADGSGAMGEDFSSDGMFGQSLVVEELKGVQGELTLRVGDNEPFGVVNVGDPNALAKLLQKQEDPETGLVVSERSFGESLFNELNEAESRVNLLVGARKFAEGWSSWRVSSVGLMNVGKNEGAQIIQLFGRGVRLKGLDFGLKRSRSIPGEHPDHVQVLETLNVFGLHADYMKQFEEILREEGVPTQKVEIALPVYRSYEVDLAAGKLRTIRVGEGGDFSASVRQVALPAEPPEDFLKRPVPLDWYPKVRVLEGEAAPGMAALKNTGSLKDEQIAFLDLDGLYFALVAYKKEKGWPNLLITKAAVEGLVRNPGWYKLSIPEDDLRFSGDKPLRRVRVWQEIVLALLKKFCDRFYKNEKARYQARFIEYARLAEDDGNFFSEYRFEVEESKTQLVDTLNRIKSDLDNGSFRSPAGFHALRVFEFERHLYRPLVHLAKKDDISVSPIELNEGERRFVEDLRRYYEDNPAYFADQELYLLRNMTRGRGIGFFEAGNFYPDFIMWQVPTAGATDVAQSITFIDPKGIARLDGEEDPKIRFHTTIKDVQDRLNDTSQEAAGAILNSFVVSNTPYSTLGSNWGRKSALESQHLLFQEDENYIERMFDLISRASD